MERDLREHLQEFQKILKISKRFQKDPRMNNLTRKSLMRQSTAISMERACRDILQRQSQKEPAETAGRDRLQRRPSETACKDGLQRKPAETACRDYCKKLESILTLVCDKSMI